MTQFVARSRNRAVVRCCFAIALPLLLAAGCAQPASAARGSAPAGGDDVERWGVYTVSLRGPRTGNPFVEVDLFATFTKGERNVTVDGFYDGEGVFLIRFMPDETGTWTYATRSNNKLLDGRKGQLTVGPPAAGNHGPVNVVDKFHFAYADGTPHYSIGTTAYAWIHQPAALQEQTLRTLRDGPFNKMRMLIFPKNYDYNAEDPPFYVFPKTAGGDFEHARFDVAFFRHLERQIQELGKLNIEADLILFHPYDKPGRWGFNDLPADVNARYLRYLIARVAAYRNVWWSMANEWDLVKTKNEADWNALLDVIQQRDPYRRLTSIHNADKVFDYSRAPITHVSVQIWKMHEMGSWRKRFGKPVINDECEYEGNIEEPWGSISARELVHRFWLGKIQGTYVGHSETYRHPQDIIWWSKGGKLHGDSPSRIAFLHDQLRRFGAMEPLPYHWVWERTPAARQGNSFFVYLGQHQPGRFSSWTMGPIVRSHPEFKDARWAFSLVDTWGMTESPISGTFAGDFSFEIPARPGLAIRAVPQDASK